MADRYASLKQGLVGAWIPSISGSGLLLPDLSGRGNNGVLTNMDASDWVSSQYGRALDFDGSNDKVELGARDLLRQPLSISAWAYRRSSNANHTIIDGATDPSNSFGAHLRFTTANKIRWYFNNANLSLVDTTTTPSLNTWHHVTGTFDGVTSRIYFNGVLEASTTGDAFGTAAGNYRLGCLSTVYGTDVGVMDGLIDDVRLYSRALTEPEIRLLASEPGIGFKPAKKLSRFSQRFTYKPPKAKVFEGVRVRDHDYSSLRQGLVGAWCPSLPNGGSGNTLPDVSGRGNHGTLTNMGPEDWVASEGGRVLDFDGVNDRIVASNNTSFENGVVSVSGWMRRTGAAGGSNAVVFSKGTLEGNANSTCAIYWNETLGWSWFIVDASNNLTIVRSNTVTAQNQWVHVAGVASPAGVFLYLSGVLANSTTTAAVKNSTHESFIGGASVGGGSFASLLGQVDDVRAYNRALSESEIRLLASRPGIGLQPSPTRFIAREKKTGLRRKILTGQT